MANEDFDVLLSFAGPERDYARAIHDICKANGLRVFFDEEFQHEIWGKNLVEYLDDAYRERGRYVVGLISAAYRDRGYTRVERRAAFDRMLEQAGEYFLPVVVDDTRIPGLPKATAHLDLRVDGVIGICKVLVRKVLGRQDPLAIPPGLAIPRVPMGRIPAAQLTTHLLALCQRPQVTAFGVLVYDERNVELRKLLRDQDYWDALDSISGPNFDVFAIRDTVKRHEDLMLELMTAASLHRGRSRGYYFSKLLKSYFGVDKTRLQYPSLLVFLATERRIDHCWLIPLGRSRALEDAFARLSELFAAIAGALEDAGGTGARSDAIRQRFRDTLPDLGYRLYIQRPPRDTEQAVRGLMAFVED